MRRSRPAMGSRATALAPPDISSFRRDVRGTHHFHNLIHVRLRKGNFRQRFKQGIYPPIGPRVLVVRLSLQGPYRSLPNAIPPAPALAISTGRATATGTASTATATAAGMTRGWRTQQFLTLAARSLMPAAFGTRVGSPLAPALLFVVESSVAHVDRAMAYMHGRGGGGATA